MRENATEMQRKKTILFTYMFTRKILSLRLIFYVSKAGGGS